jgi:lipopolysaccharide/colanic/teichoic acid biosynthesis glycosyltransferase
MSVYEMTYYFGKRRQHFSHFKLTYNQFKLIKRIFDLTICFLLLPVLFIPMALISILIVLDSSGSPIFVQERVGYGGRRFKMYKFRTMRNNKNDSQHRAFMQSYVAGKVTDETGQDQRVAKFKPIQQKDLTQLGRLLRKTSLDELPQIFNVINGEMSLIGPRPNVPWEVEAYKPWHYDRLEAMPGITGLAQVMGRSDISFDNIARYDIQYVKNQAIHIDLWIVWRTMKAILKGVGAG